MAREGKAEERQVMVFGDGSDQRVPAHCHLGWWCGMQARQPQPWKGRQAPGITASHAKIMTTSPSSSSSHGRQVRQVLLLFVAQFSKSESPSQEFMSEMSQAGRFQVGGSVRSDTDRKAEVGVQCKREISFQTLFVFPAVLGKKKSLVSHCQFFPVLFLLWVKAFIIG